MDQNSNSKISRRSFLTRAGITGAGVVSAPILSKAFAKNSEVRETVQAGEKFVAEGAQAVSLTINGQKRSLKIEPRVTLLDCLRENLQMTGTKKGCDHGQCGACTVLVNGRRVNSCLSFAIMHEADEITTIEGLGTPEKMHPMQKAFVDHDAYQCGYCTSGQILIGSSPDERTLRKKRCRCPRVHERKYLPLRRLSKYFKCNSRCSRSKTSRERLTPMQFFNYQKVGTEDDLFQTLNAKSGIPLKLLAGGTTLIDLMKLDVEKPQLLIDLNALPLAKIEKTKDGGVHIGAMVRNSDLSHDEYIQTHFPVLSQALLSGASAQLRNKATTAGNLLQRTRCVYFRESSHRCNKREPGSGCDAIKGMNRNLAVLGASTSCIATNPSDMNVALAALEAKVHLRSREGTREVDFADFHLLPGDRPDLETVLKNGELITGVTLAPLPQGTKSLYFKTRDRASYEFALASAAVVITLKSGRIERARIAMGGVGTKPWRSKASEKILEGGLPSEARFKSAAEEFLRGAVPQTENGFKIELAKRCLAHALKKATEEQGA